MREDLISSRPVHFLLIISGIGVAALSRNVKVFADRQQGNPGEDTGEHESREGEKP
jgi:hypothetical protein